MSGSVVLFFEVGVLNGVDLSNQKRGGIYIIYCTLSLISHTLVVFCGFFNLKGTGKLEFEACKGQEGIGYRVGLALYNVQSYPEPVSADVCLLRAFPDRESIKDLSASSLMVGMW